MSRSINALPPVMLFEGREAEDFLHRLKGSSMPFLNLQHTYVHIWPLQPFSQDYVLASHTTHVVYVTDLRIRTTDF